MDDTDLRNKRMAENIKHVDLSKLPIEQLKMIVTIIEANSEEKPITEADNRLQKQLDWMRSLKIGDKVAHYHEGIYDIKSIIEVSCGYKRISHTCFTLDEEGKYSNHKIIPITQEILDHIEKENIVEKLTNKTKYNCLSLNQLRVMMKIVEQEDNDAN